MKTVEELAKEYQEKEHPIWTGKGMATELKNSFISGYNKAMEWISVDDDLPEIRDKVYRIITKDNFGIVYVFTVLDIKYGLALKDQLIKQSITHWRYI